MVDDVAELPPTKEEAEVPEESILAKEGEVEEIANEQKEMPEESQPVLSQDRDVDRKPEKVVEDTVVAERIVEEEAGPEDFAKALQEFMAEEDQRPPAHAVRDFGAQDKVSLSEVTCHNFSSLSVRSRPQ